jgi:hypothetical protein
MMKRTDDDHLKSDESKLKGCLSCHGPNEEKREEEKKEKKQDFFPCWTKNENE